MALKYNDRLTQVKPGLSDNFWLFVPLAFVVAIVAWLVVIFLCSHYTVSQ